MRRPFDLLDMPSDTITVRPAWPSDFTAYADLYRDYRDFYKLRSDAAIVDRVWGWIADAYTRFARWLRNRTGHGSRGLLAAPTDCAELCAPGHSMATMACVLALLFTGFFLVLVRRKFLSELTPLTMGSFRRVAAYIAANAPAPPNLDALSISRT